MSIYTDLIDNLEELKLDKIKSILPGYLDEMKDKNTRRATVEEIVEFFKKFPNGMPRLTKVSDEERERMRINSYDPLL